jgi:hypothetical protein
LRGICSSTIAAVRTCHAEKHDGRQATVRAVKDMIN